MTRNRYQKSRSLCRYLNPEPSAWERKMLPVYRGIKFYRNLLRISTNNVSVTSIHKFYVTRSCLSSRYIHLLHNYTPGLYNISTEISCVLTTDKLLCLKPMACNAFVITVQWGSIK
jgi:hypothetical protein